MRNRAHFLLSRKGRRNDFAQHAARSDLIKYILYISYAYNRIACGIRNAGKKEIQIYFLAWKLHSTDVQSKRLIDVKIIFV